MNGVELTSSELTYLLATLDCREVVGLEDPALFPSSASAQGKAYKKGQQQLKEHGWLKPVSNGSEEYELDALLLEVVSVLAGPEYMIASAFTDADGDSQMLFHYVVDETTVELVALKEKLYWLGALEAQELIADRIAELMHLEPTKASIEMEIESNKLDEMKTLVGKGKLAEAKSTFGETDLDEDHVMNVIGAIEDGSRGSLVAVQIDGGEITSGRRFNVYGSGASAWMSFSPSSASSKVILTPCSTNNVLEFIKHLLED